MKTHTLLFLSILFMSFNVSSNSSIMINGLIFDKNTKAPVINAHISVCGYSIGLTSNEYGEFSFKIPDSYKNEEICISCIGYEIFKISISNLMDGQFLSIGLVPINYNISEVKIVAKNKDKTSAKEIIKRAILNIPINYPQKQFSLHGYYREYLKFKDKKYLNLFESAISIFENSFSKPSLRFNGWIYQQRYNKCFDVSSSFQTTYSNIKKNSKFIDKMSSVKYVPNIIMPVIGGNELSILFAHDPIRRYKEESFSFVDYFNIDFANNHFFSLDSIVFRGDIPIYSISFSYKDNYRYKAGKQSGNPYAYTTGEMVKNHDLHGNILIQCNSYKIEHFAYTNYSIEDSENKIYEIIVDYKEYRDKMYLNYLSFSNFFKISIPSKDANLFLSINKTPPKLKNTFFEDGKIILRFDKALRLSSAKKNKNYMFRGGINISNGDSLNKENYIPLIKQPDYVNVVNEREIEISFPYSNSLSNMDSIKIADNIIYFDTFSLKIENLFDKSGNKFGESNVLPFHQYREFYTNNVDFVTKPIYSKRVELDLYRNMYSQQVEMIDKFWESYNYPMVNSIESMNK